MSSSPLDPLAEPARPRIWVVDDSALERESARRALESECELALFADGPAMLEALARSSPPDVLVLDWQMPGLSGIEVCRFLRANPATEALAVLMLTVHARPEDVVEALSAGADDYVIKPFHRAELLARVRSLMRQHALRVRAERAEATARSLLEGLPEALLAIDGDGRVTYVNAAAQAMLGSPAAGVLGRPLREVLPALQVDLIPTQAVDRFALPDVVVGQETYAPVMRRLAPFDTRGGTTITLRNVTAQRRLEARRLDFYSVVVHDLRAPLTSILLRTGQMLRGRFGAVSEEMGRALERVQQQVHNLSALVGDFLELARLEAAGLEVESRPVDLGGVLAEVVEDFGALAEAQGVRLGCRTQPPQGVHVQGDRRRLHQLATNLVSNAIKFTGTGGEVEASADADAGWARLQVRDTGRGIPAEHLPRIFHRYTRLEVHAQPVAGTGLGLMIVREIVEAHRGRIEVESKEGHGSTFRVFLPLPAP